MFRDIQLSFSLPIQRRVYHAYLHAGIVLAALLILFGEPSVHFILLSFSLISTLYAGRYATWCFKHQVIRDHLTDLYSRGYFFEEWLPKELKRQERFKGTIAFVLCDIDDFKTINDNKGHKAGDEALCFVARVMMESVRAIDLAVRFGGDEILLALSGSDEEEAKEVIARIGKSLSFLHQSFPLSLSAEVSLWIPGKNPEEAIHEADLKMYQEKAKRHRENNLLSERSL